MINDKQLLQQYAQERSESAFGELVARHLDYVYSTALRVVNGDAPLAQDVTQTVFIDLARKAVELPRDVVLAGWLHRHTCYTAATAVRTERRRQTREHAAMEMRALDDNTRPEWEQVAPYLDESLNELNPADRDALVLRFLRQQDLRSVGVALGISEDAARKRVDRALEKLHVLLKHRGATLSVAALGTALATEAVTAAPAGLAAAITAAALSGTTITSTAVFAATKGIAMTTFQKAIVTATAVVLAGVGIYEARQVALAHNQVQTLQQQQQAPLAGRVVQLTRERDGLTNKLAVMRDENERLQSNAVELLKLRGMVGTLRRELESQKTAAAKASTNLAEASMSAHKPGAYISKDQLADAGFKTPEAALQTFFGALLSSNYDHVVAAMSAQSGASDPMKREEFETRFRVDEELSRVQGIQMVAKKVVADDRVDIEFLIYEKGKAPLIHIQQLLKEGDEWKAGNSIDDDSSWGQGGQIQHLIPSTIQ